MALTRKQINKAFQKFIKFSSSDHRYASYDYCYNYFHSFKDKTKIASKENLEKSCLVLGFYLASWGMLRASSSLLQKSIVYYIPIIEWIAKKCPKEVWNIDVNNYSDSNIQLLIQVYNEIDRLLTNLNKEKRILITKIMLGVFGNTPAFDEYFTKTFRTKYGYNSKFRRFNKDALITIREFYRDNRSLINRFRNKCKTFRFPNANKLDLIYSRAKIIDMIGFGHSYKEKKRKAKWKSNQKT